MRKLLIILTCFAAASCTKSTEPQQEEPRVTTAPASSAPPEPADSRPAIVFLGDSLAEGLGVPPESCFPQVVQRRLDARSLSYRVVNLGLSGDTTTGGVARLPHALSLKPAVLVIELGGNDGLRGIPVAATKANLEKMIVAARKEGVQVLLAGMSLPPNYGKQYIADFENAYRDLARKYKVPLIPFLLSGIAEQLATRPGLLQQDGIHPTTAGHELIADTVMRHLSPMLSSRAARRNSH